MLLLLIFLFLYNYEVLGRGIWTPDQANNWFNSQKYIMGSEYMTSNAVNQIEMFQAETFDADLIDKELEVYGKLGMNTIRVFMHDIPYTIDPAGFKSRLTTLVEIANKYGIRPTLLFFSGGAIENPVPGKQPKPQPGVQTSAGAETPSENTLNDPSTWSTIETYVKDIVGMFANDSRVLMWDMWNEPVINKTSIDTMIPLVFEWARSMNPIQPLTSSVWRAINSSTTGQIQINNSDVMSFHNYGGPQSFADEINYLRQYNRPVIATEYMNRKSDFTHDDGTFKDILPVGKQMNIGMISWGSVNGKNQYNLPWDSSGHPYVAYPPTVWFQDIIRQDRTPYLLEEAQLIKRLNGCPLGHHSKVNNWTCYNTYETPLDFSDAQAACKNSWSNMVTINNAFENGDILNYASSLTNCNSFYIGLYNGRNGWTWPMTVPYNNPAYRNWKNGYPISNSNANCVVLNKDGSWTNQDCATLQCYICSY